ncbi:integrase core domain-containing protein [Weissella paramesenteroides]
MVTRYEADFKKSIVEMVKESGPLAGSIRNWVKKYAPVDVNGALFESTLAVVGIKHSYSRKECPYDNARIESCHSLLKRELIYQYAFETITDVQAGVGWYVNWYNNTRLSLREVKKSHCSVLILRTFILEKYYKFQTGTLTSPGLRQAPLDFH